MNTEALIFKPHVTTTCYSYTFINARKFKNKQTMPGRNTFLPFIIHFSFKKIHLLQGSELSHQHLPHRKEWHPPCPILSRKESYFCWKVKRTIHVGKKNPTFFFLPYQCTLIFKTEEEKKKKVCSANLKIRLLVKGQDILIILFYIKNLL